MEAPRRLHDRHAADADDPANMVSLSLSTLSSLNVLVQALEKADSSRTSPLRKALVEFEATARDDPNPAAVWRALREQLLILERDDDPLVAKEVTKLRAACDTELGSLAPVLGSAAGGVAMIVKDREGARLLEEIEGHAEELHLTPLSDPPSAGSETEHSVEVSSSATPWDPPPSLEVLTDELLPLLLSAAPPPSKSILDDSALLVTLALYPSLVLPPGKTLLSLFARPSFASSDADAIEETPARKRKRALDEVAMDSLGKRGKGMEGVTKALHMTTEERVAVMMKSAYWDQVRCPSSVRIFVRTLMLTALLSTDRRPAPRPAAVDAANAQARPTPDRLDRRRAYTTSTVVACESLPRPKRSTSWCLGS